ncbi:MAG: ABC transporter permease [Planctomycetaceae bacterium]
MILRAIHRKLFRNLWSMKGQTIAIALVVASGVAMSVMSLSTLQSLQATRDTYYERFRFANVFASFRRGPLSLRERIETIPGVSSVDLRIVETVNIIVEGMAEPAVGRLISVPDHGPSELNQLYLRSGRMPEAGRLEVAVGESFANVHGFRPGSTVDAILNGRLRTLRIAGIVLSPEYIVEMNSADMLPDFRRFGVFWMPRTEMEAAFDMNGACNDLSVTLMRGAEEREVIRQLDNLLDDWGGVGSYGRDDHLSHRFISDEISQLRAMGLVTPVIFMLVAAFLLNMVMTRLIDLQREQIAALKAFGYHNREVAAHYLSFVAIIVLAGIIVGTLLGIRMGLGLTRMYTRFFHFPLFQFDTDWMTCAITTAICGLAAVAGTTGSLIAASRLPPAEAMRPKSPGEFRPSLIEKLGLQRWLPQSWRMILRQIRRRPLKTALSVLGIAMAAGVVVLGSYASNALDFIVDFQFRQVQRQDLWINFDETMTADAIYDVQHLPGVLSVEPFRALRVRVHSGPRSRRVSVLGMSEERKIFRVVAQTGAEPALANDGLMLSQRLAELLKVQTGDSVTVEVLEGKRPIVSARVIGTVDDLSGMNAFALQPFVNRLAMEGPVYSGAWVSVDSRELNHLYTELKATPGVVGVTANAASIQSFLDTIAENQLRMQGFVIGFAVVIAAGVVYNTALISLSERDQELATMRVLGFTRAEVSAVLLGELAILTLLAIPLGLCLGYGMAWVSSKAIHTDQFRIPLVIYPATYAKAAIVVLLAATVSGAIVRRRLDRLDLFAVLKGQE